MNISDDDVVVFMFYEDAWTKYMKILPFDKARAVSSGLSQGLFVYGTTMCQNIWDENLAETIQDYSEREDSNI
jgi:hypothetical protein